MARKFRTKEWAVLMFIAHDNDLAPFTRAKTDEIRSVGSTAAADVITHVDTPGASRIDTMRVSGGRDFLIAKVDKAPNSGDKRTLMNFVNRTLEDFRSRRSMLVISTHGTGFSIITDDGARAGGHDAHDGGDDGGDTLDNVELKAALMPAVEKRGPFDLIVFDACLMNMFEVAYQLRDTARFMVGSQSNIPVPGCRFAPTFEIMRDERISTADMARVLVDNGMVTHLFRDECSAMAALDLSKAAEVAHTISALANALTKALDKPDACNAIELAHLTAVAFLDSEAIDLIDFCQRLALMVDDRDVRNAATAVMRAAASFVVCSNPRGAVVEGARGISITLPRRDIPKDYDKLDFAGDTTWLQFLKAYLKKCCQPVSEGEHGDHVHQHQHEPAA